MTTASVHIQLTTFINENQQIKTKGVAEKHMEMNEKLWKKGGKHGIHGFYGWCVMCVMINNLTIGR